MFSRSPNSFEVPTNFRPSLTNGGGHPSVAGCAFCTGHGRMAFSALRLWRCLGLLASWIVGGRDQTYCHVQGMCSILSFGWRAAEPAHRYHLPGDGPAAVPRFRGCFENSGVDGRTFYPPKQFIFAIPSTHELHPKCNVNFDSCPVVRFGLCLTLPIYGREPHCQGTGMEGRLRHPRPALQRHRPSYRRAMTLIVTIMCQTMWRMYFTG